MKCNMAGMRNINFQNKYFRFFEPLFLKDDPFNFHNFNSFRAFVLNKRFPANLEID